MSTQQNEGRIYEFGTKDRIRVARESKGLTQDQLAETTGLSRQTISNYERGETKRYSRASLRLIAWATEYDFEWLMSGNIPATSPQDGTCVVSHLPELRLAA